MSPDHTSWYYHTPRIKQFVSDPSVLEPTLDPCLKRLVSVLTSAGYTTLPSCSGHYYKKEDIDPGEMEELEIFSENKLGKFRLDTIYNDKETDMRITVNQLRRIIKEEVSRLSRRRMVENMMPGTRVVYSHPDFPGEMTGVIEFDEFENSNVFIPDASFHKRLISLGYDPEAGLHLDGASVTPA